MSAPNLNLWLPCLKACANPRLRLICFPYAGAGPSAFRTWSSALPEAVELRVLQLPGRSFRYKEPPLCQMQSLVDSVHSLVHGLEDRPLALFGHSFGAIVAFEVARRIHRLGPDTIPAHLFVSGHVAPQIPNPNTQLHHLPDAEFLSELRALNGIPSAMLESQELVQFVLPGLRGDFLLLESYQYRDDTPLSCPITSFQGSNDPRTSGPGISAWKAQTKGRFSCRTLPGDHFFIDTARDQLLAVMMQDLTQFISRS